MPKRPHHRSIPGSLHIFKSRNRGQGRAQRNPISSPEFPVHCKPKHAPVFVWLRKSKRFNHAFEFVCVLQQHQRIVALRRGLLGCLRRSLFCLLDSHLLQLAECSRIRVVRAPRLFAFLNFPRSLDRYPQHLPQFLLGEKRTSISLGHGDRFAPANRAARVHSRLFLYLLFQEVHTINRSTDGKHTNRHKNSANNQQHFANVGLFRDGRSHLRRDRAWCLRSGLARLRLLSWRARRIGTCATFPAELARDWTPAIFAKTRHVLLLASDWLPPTSPTSGQNNSP